MSDVARDSPIQWGDPADRSNIESSTSSRNKHAPNRQLICPPTKRGARQDRQATPEDTEGIDAQLPTSSSQDVAALRSARLKLQAKPTRTRQQGRWGAPPVGPHETSGGSLRVGPGPRQRFSVRFSLLKGLLVYGGEFTLIPPVDLVQSFPRTRIKNNGSPSAL